MQVIELRTEDKVRLYGILYEAKQKLEEAQEKDIKSDVENKENLEKVVISVHGMSTNMLKRREKIFAEILNKNGIAYLCFDNRGHDLMNYIKTESGQDEKIGGTSFEDVTECYYDIKAAIEKVKEMGYKKIYLQGHSLGSTKVVYAYNRLKQENYENINEIKAVILLSLVDIPALMKIYLGDRYEDVLKYAESKEEKGVNELMPPKTFVNPISVKTFLQYVKYNEDINFARYSEKGYEYEELNNIEVPLFMRWGNVNEFIQIPADILSKMLEQKIRNDKKDIGYINGANHSYVGKEEELAEQVKEFVRRY